MTQATPNNYWISSTALRIELNALGNPDYIQASCVSGAQILVYVKDIIGYDAGHNYQRWTLQAAPTVFNTHTAKYVYAAIPRPNTFPQGGGQGGALIVFPSEEIDIYGYAHDISQNEDGDEIDDVRLVGSQDYYYINLGGIITSSGENGSVNRDWQQRINTGYLSSDEAIAAGPNESEWYQYSMVDRITTFIKDLTMKVGTKFLQLYAKVITVVTGGEIRFGESETAPSITGVAVLGEKPEEGEEIPSTPLSSTTHIVTPAFGEGQWLSKKHDDTAEGNLTFKGNIDVFGNFVAEKDSHLKGNVVIGVSPSIPASTQHWGKSEWGTFVKGILTGTGAQIDINGNAELESLIIRRFLEVPELRYNRVSVHSGTEWFTKGSGLIESVIPDTDEDGNILNTGTIKLHLEDGEFSTIAENDYCMGIFHNLNGNATETKDDKQGTMEYSGFCTVYFRIKEIKELVHNSEFTYELRPVSEATETSLGWSHQYHPQPQMTFACYANPNNTDRQSAVLKTTDYTVYIENSTQWTFGADNYYLIMGQLEGFSVWATNKKGQRYLKHLHGNGTMLGNVYMFGVIDQFDRLADTVEVTASPRINADFSLADGETMTLTAKMLSYDGIKRTGVVYTIKRFSSNSVRDAAWNASRGEEIKDGTILLTTEDLRIDNLPQEGEQEETPVYDLAVQFTVTGTRKLPAEEGGEDYSVEHDVVIKNMGHNNIVSDLVDPFFAVNTPKHVNFSVISPRNENITSKVARWSIERHSSSSESDLAWQNRDKVKNFNGSIDILWSDNPDTDDFDPDETIDSTQFTITAYDSQDETLAQTNAVM